GARMFRRAVSLVLLPAVAPVALGELHHEPVARDLGDDRRSGDGDRAPVAADEGARFAGKSLRNDIAVDQRHRRRSLQPAIAARMPHNVACKMLSRSMRRTWPMAIATQDVAMISA